LKGDHPKTYSRKFVYQGLLVCPLSKPADVRNPKSSPISQTKYQNQPWTMYWTWYFRSPVKHCLQHMLKHSSLLCIIYSSLG